MIPFFVELFHITRWFVLLCALVTLYQTYNKAVELWNDQNGSDVWVIIVGAFLSLALLFNAAYTFFPQWFMLPLQ